MSKNSKIKITQKNFLGIKNPVWWSQETPAVFGLSYDWMKGFTRVNQYYKKDYQVVVVPFKNDYGWHFLEKKKSIELARYILSQYLEDPSFIWKKMNIWKKNKQRFLAVCNQVRKKKTVRLSNNDLWKLYDKLMSAFINEFAPVLVIEAFEPYVTDVFAKEIPYRDPEKLHKLSILEQPSIKSFMIDQRMDLLKICFEIFRNPKLLSYFRKNKARSKQVSKNFPDFYKRLKKHSNKFFWLKNNYKDIQFLSPNYFLGSVTKEIKTRSREQIENEFQRLKTGPARLRRKKNRIIKELKLTPKIVSTYKLLEILAQWQDQRKNMTLVGNFYLNELVKQIAKSKKLPLTEVRYMRPEEIKELLLEDKLIDKKILRARRRLSVWIGMKDKEWWFTEERAKKIQKMIFKEKVAHQKSISGMPASPGTVIGKVKVVLDPQKDKFYKNEILVTPMTRPEYLPLMRKAKAIVTDGGGITCHAAIVSREFGIPCVVGTKVATKILKNGDKVEVRAHRGMVTKI